MKQFKMSSRKKIFAMGKRSNYVMLSIKSLILTLLYAFTINSGVKAQNIGYVYADSILLSISGYKQSLIKSDSLKKVYSFEIEQSQNALQVKYNTLISKYKVGSDETLAGLKQRMTPEDTLNLSIILQESKLIELRRDGYNDILSMMYTRDIKPIIEKVNAVIKEYAEKNKIDVVFVMEQIGASVAYSNPSKDITKQIIAILSKK